MGKACHVEKVSMITSSILSTIATIKTSSFDGDIIINSACVHVEREMLKTSSCVLIIYGSRRKLMFQTK